MNKFFLKKQAIQKESDLNCSHTYLSKWILRDILTML